MRTFKIAFEVGGQFDKIFGKLFNCIKSFYLQDTLNFVFKRKRKIKEKKILKLEHVDLLNLKTVTFFKCYFLEQKFGQKLFFSFIASDDYIFFKEFTVDFQFNLTTVLYSEDRLSR